MKRLNGLRLMPGLGHHMPTMTAYCTACSWLVTIKDGYT